MLLMALTTLGHAQSSAEQSGSLLPLVVQSAEAVQVTEPGLAPTFSGYCTYRSDGYRVFRCITSAITNNSSVFAAISEYGSGGPTNRFLGAAHMTVHNIIPQNGYVDVLVDTGWSSPINLRLDIWVSP
jgi:hypothetical protein